MAIRARHYSLRTEEAYVGWIRRYILFHRKRHPMEMAEREINAFLSHLANTARVSASTHTQALSAILFLYRHVLQKRLPFEEGIVRVRRPGRLPTVMTRAEVRTVLGALHGAPSWSARCSTARECGCSRRCACASRTSSSRATRSRCATRRATRIDSFLSRG
jgi:site-specific recombinase XerD